MQGQDAVNTARAFRDALPLTGVVLTKLDGDARGGAALSVRHVTGAPIKFAGVSEKIDGLEVFHPERMASRILGMGDVLSLIEEAHKNVDVERGEEAREEGQVGQGLRPRPTSRSQIGPDAQDGRHCRDARQAAGGVGARRAGRHGRRAPDRRIEGIINSMTPQERAKPETPESVAQAPHRRRRGRVGAGSQPAAQPVRADAEDDEDGGQRAGCRR